VRGITLWGDFALFVYRYAHADQKADYRFCIQGSFLALEPVAFYPSTPLCAARLFVPD
jgi:hypothetical protein